MDNMFGEEETSASETVQSQQQEPQQDPPQDAAPGEEQDDMDDLFGDEEETEEPKFSDFYDSSLVPRQEGLSAEEYAQRQELEYAEEAAFGEGDLPPGAPTERLAELILVNLPTPASTYDQFWHVKLPNFIRIESKPFDALEWNEEEEDRENGQLIPDENVIRWRWIEDPDNPGQRIKQSNARIIRWNPDGHLSLQIGTQMYDITAHLDTSGTPSSQLAQAIKVPLINSSNPEEALSQGVHPQGLVYLVAEHQYANLLETQARITGTMNFLPTNTESLAHRKLATAVAERHTKVNKTAHYVTEVDPEFDRQQKEAADKEREKEIKKQQKEARRGRRGSRKSLRSGRLDLYSSEEDGFSDQDDGGRSAARSRSRYREDQNMDDFIEEDMDEEMVENGEQQEEEDDAPTDEMDDIEAAAEREQRRRKKTKAQREDADAEGEEDPTVTDNVPGSVTKRRLVIEGSDEE